MSSRLIWMGGISSDAATEAGYDALRGQHIRTITSALAGLNTSHLPLVIAGDFNSWQNIAVGNAPHDTLVADGFYDTASAVTAINLQYATHQQVRHHPEGGQAGLRAEARRDSGRWSAGRLEFRERHQGHRLGTALRPHHDHC